VQPIDEFEAWLMNQKRTDFRTKLDEFYTELAQTSIYYGILNDTAYQDSLYWQEQHLYGSSRLGMAKPNVEVTNYTPTNQISYTSNFRNYELTNHLGNVLSTIKDEKQQIDANNDGIVDYYEPIVITSNDYYPFGMVMPNRSYSLSSGSKYRFGFNTQEKDDEVYGAGNLNTAMFWEYDTRIGRRWNTDPKGNVFESLYATFGNNPILNNDINGDVWEKWWKPQKNNEGKYNNTISSKGFASEASKEFLGLIKSNEIFRKVFNDLSASKNKYTVAEYSSYDANGAFSPNKDGGGTIKFNNFGGVSDINKSTVFEETFHAGQHEFYKGKRDNSLANEVEAKAAKLLSGDMGDASFREQKADYSGIADYFKTGKKGKKYESSVNALINDVYDKYKKHYDSNGTLDKNSPDKIDKKALFKYLESKVFKDNKTTKK
jgi:hypothetical protein